MVIVSNATPIIALSSVNRLDILKSLFKEIIITEEVKAELIAKERYGAEFPFLDWVKIKKVRDKKFNKALSMKNGCNYGTNHFFPVQFDFFVIHYKS